MDTYAASGLGNSGRFSFALGGTIDAHWDAQGDLVSSLTPGF